MVFLHDLLRIVKPVGADLSVHVGETFEAQMTGNPISPSIF